MRGVVRKRARPTSACSSPPAPPSCAFLAARCPGWTSPPMAPQSGEAQAMAQRLLCVRRASSREPMSRTVTLCRSRLRSGAGGRDRGGGRGAGVVLWWLLGGGRLARRCWDAHMRTEGHTRGRIRRQKPRRAGPSVCSPSATRQLRARTGRYVGVASGLVERSRLYGQSQPLPAGSRDKGVRTACAACGVAGHTGASRRSSPCQRSREPMPQLPRSLPVAILRALAASRYVLRICSYWCA